MHPFAVIRQNIQVRRSEEERKEFMRRAEETQHILKEIEILKEQVMQQPDPTSSPAIIGHYGYTRLNTDQ